MKIHRFIQTRICSVLYFIELRVGSLRHHEVWMSWSSLSWPEPVNCLWFFISSPSVCDGGGRVRGMGWGGEGANGFLSEGDKSGCGDWRTNGASPWFTRTPAPPSPLQERKVLVLIVSAWLQRRAGRWKDSDTETKTKTIKEILKMWRCRPVSVFTLWKLKTTRHLRFLIFGDVNFRWVGKESSCVGTEAVRDGK